ncbi:MAG: VOC family protein [Actinomycetota bacterium]|nr:VOC family protein [Actinomycetota bacterium]
MLAFHLSLPVADVDAAAAFYAERLGAQRGRSGPDWADLSFFGHQLSLHAVDGYVADPTTCVVDGDAVPVRHHGMVLDLQAWTELVERLRAAGEPFLLAPRSRFVGEPGEQHTFFLRDPSGNALEVKAFPGGAWR